MGIEREWGQLGSQEINQQTKTVAGKGLAAAEPQALFSKNS